MLFRLGIKYGGALRFPYQKMGLNPERRRALVLQETLATVRQYLLHQSLPSSAPDISRCCPVYLLSATTHCLKVPSSGPSWKDTAQLLLFGVCFRNPPMCVSVLPNTVCGVFQQHLALEVRCWKCLPLCLPLMRLYLRVCWEVLVPSSQAEWLHTGRTIPSAEVVCGSCWVWKMLVFF